MIKLIAAIVLFITSLSTMAFERDKQLHFAGSALISATAYQAFSTSRHPVLYSLATTMSVGVAKELYDRKRTGFSKADLAADLVGALVGIYVSKHLFVTSRSVTYVNIF